jgi:D-serine deaminase-like pyridoxal phosphate-dependent protein
MSFAVSEAEMLVDRGHTDILVAYPSVQTHDVDALVGLNRRDGVTVSLVVDSREHLDILDHRARTRNGCIPVVVEIDMGLRAIGGRVHVGVHRSSAFTAEDVVDLAREIGRREALEFAGVMGYEAQIAGLAEANPFSKLLNPIRVAIKRASIPAVRERRQRIADALAAANIALPLFNGGGTGSLVHTDRERAITEVTAGSGFLCSHLFDYYPHLHLSPAAYFALQVVRKPSRDIATCHGGGYVASGEAGRDRLPIPALPVGLSLIGLEGAGEVQTPLRGARSISIGDPIFFRHAKAGELAEHFNEYLLVRGDRVVERAPTYRGEGYAFV